MKTWTTKQRYATYDTYSKKELDRLQKLQRDSKWHLAYHLQPKSGLMNDPNGFTYINGEWRLAYQNFPFGPVHGLKSWENLVSNDLQNWRYIGSGLQPHAPYSMQGVYSGSGLAQGERQFLMYTGNVRTEDGGRISTQLGAWVEPDGELHELSQPLISGQPNGYTAHFRDPQILERDGRYYAILGAQREDKRGTILVYSAERPEGPWQLDGPLDFGFDSLGYMIECPNLAFVDGSVVLIFCPQGLDQSVCAYDNIYPNMYIVADDIDWASRKLVNPGPLHNLDVGFDCYAAQVVNEPNDHAHLISWMGLPDTTYASDEEDWQGCYSLARELHVIGKRLKQLPMMDSLIGAQMPVANATIDLVSVLHFEWQTGVDETLVVGNSKEQLRLKFNDTGVTVDRSGVASSNADDFGKTRSVPLVAGKHSADLYLDRSCFELYVDDGAGVLSGRYFPEDATNWTLKQADDTQVAVTGHKTKSIF